MEKNKQDLTPFEEETKELEEVKSVSIETKSQTIYYEDIKGNIKKHHEFTNDRINQNEASELLNEKGITHRLIIRTFTERVFLSIPVDKIESFIDHNERFRK